MTTPATEIVAPEYPTPAEPAHWPEDPIDMMTEMMREHANALNVLFQDMMEHSAQLCQRDSFYQAQGYIRLALRAQAGCRSSMEAIARADRATRRNGRGGHAGEK